MRTIAILLVIGFFSIPAKADFVIDTFLDGPQTVIANSSNNNVFDDATNLNPSEVLDGRRRLAIQGAMSGGFIRAVVDTSVGSLSYESFNPAYTNQFGGTLLLTHIAGDRRTTSDILANLNDSYVIEFERAYWGGSGPQTASLRLSSPTGVGNSTLIIPESSTAFSLAVPMSDFSAVDFSKAFNLTLDIGGLSPNASFQIHRIGFVSSVPEPSSCCLVAPLVFGLLCRRRRAAVKDSAC